MISFLKSIAQLLNQKEVEYLVVGGVARMLHGENWKPSDLDILIFNESANIEKFNCVVGCKLANELRAHRILRIYGKPFTIDFHSKLDGLELCSTKANRDFVIIDDVSISVISKDDLQTNLSTVKSRINEYFKS